MIEKPLVLIPAAGFGTRMGSPHAKELLPGPDGRPLIENALRQAQERHWPVHVITRKEKTQLIQFLERYKELEISIQLIESSREWPDTLLQSQSVWRERNLLCLPDTVYDPPAIWDSLVESSAEIAAAVFEPGDFSKWGVMKISDGSFELCEKPQIQKPSMKAWGLLCFSKKRGQDLLQAQLESTFDHQWRKLSGRIELFSLKSFKDLTRTR